MERPHKFLRQTSGAVAYSPETGEGTSFGVTGVLRVCMQDGKGNGGTKGVGEKGKGELEIAGIVEAAFGVGSGAAAAVLSAVARGEAVALLRTFRF